MTGFNNRTSDALPLTVVHKMISEHFSSPLPAGKTVKKAIVIGYDGFRTDAIDIVQNLSTSGIMTLAQQGGLYHAFTGGIPGVNEQLTVTAPSWMAATTGGWSDYNGTTDNGVPKNSAKTFLTALAEQGMPTAMVVTWADHIQITYQPDVLYAEQNNLPVEYISPNSDDAAFSTVYSYVSKQAAGIGGQDPDAIFCVFEYADAAGHTVGFGNYHTEYITACQTVDTRAYQLIKAIEARDTYAQEDWLIILSTDHGGVANGHGSQMSFDRMIWIACNKQIPISEENLRYALLP